MNKIKVLYFGFSPSLGGIEMYSYKLISKLYDRVDFVIVKMTNEKIPFEDELKELGCKICSLTHRTRNYIKYLKELKELFSDSYDYVYYNEMNFSWFEPIVYANKSSAKLIIHAHSTDFADIDSFKTKVLNYIGLQVVKHSEYIKFACSKKTGESVFGTDFIEINNGINLSNFAYNHENRMVIRNELGISEDTLVIGQVARLDNQKNPMFLLEVFNIIHHQNNNSKLIILGQGYLRDSMDKYIAENGLQDSVIFMGRRYDANRYYSVFDIFLMPSLYEGLSISIVEAQANGLKCFTSTTVDEESNVTGSVSFLPLENGAQYWVDVIASSNLERDENSISKIPDDFDDQKSYEKIYKILLENV